MRSGHGRVRLKWPNDLVVEDGAGAAQARRPAGRRRRRTRRARARGDRPRPQRAHAGRVRRATSTSPGATWPRSAKRATRNAIAAAVLSHLLPALAHVRSRRPGAFLAALRRARRAGRPRRRPAPARRRSGTPSREGLAPDGALRVRLDDGALRVVHSGEVSVRMRGRMTQDWLFDFGNTRLKCAPLRADGSAGPGARARAVGDSMRLPSGDVAYLASVASEAARVQLLDALGAALPPHRHSRARTATFDGLRIAYAQPAQARRRPLPRDARRARRVARADRRRRHRAHHRPGRRRRPPPRRPHRAVADADARSAACARGATRAERAATYAEFADDTEDALASGCEGAALALVERSVAEATRLLGATPRVLLHGGGADALHAHLPRRQSAPGARARRPRALGARGARAHDVSRAARVARRDQRRRRGVVGLAPAAAARGRRRIARRRAAPATAGRKRRQRARARRARAGRRRRGIARRLPTTRAASPSAPSRIPRCCVARTIDCNASVAFARARSPGRHAARLARVRAGVRDARSRAGARRSHDRRGAGRSARHAHRPGPQRRRARSLRQRRRRASPPGAAAGGGLQCAGRADRRRTKMEGWIDAAFAPTVDAAVAKNDLASPQARAIDCADLLPPAP